MTASPSVRIDPDISPRWGRLRSDGKEQHMTIAIITAFCYSVAELYKLTTWNTKFIPVMCALIGTALGTLGYYFVPEFPGSDLLESLIIGLASGLAATGTHEAVTK